jgi:hypothetical protein
MGQGSTVPLSIQIAVGLAVLRPGRDVQPQFIGIRRGLRAVMPGITDYC